MNNISLLDLVDKYPYTENIIREYDSVAGCCLLCTHLFDTIKEIEDEREIDLSSLVDKLIETVSLQSK